MKNIIAYYYNLHPENLLINNNKYFFSYLNSNYVFEIFDRPISDVDPILKLDMQLLDEGLMVHEIIRNIENEAVTYVNNIPYILMEITINPKLKISLNDICYFNNVTVKNREDERILRNNWVDLWETKNDYFESQINEIGRKYPNLCNYANYYIGMAENAIIYVKNANIIDENLYVSASHKRIDFNEMLLSLYNPLNLIYDIRVRDPAEYIKSSFFNGGNAIELVKEYFYNNYINYKEALLFYGRLLYPSYFFDIYDEIINNNLSEDEVNNIVSKSEDYEVFLRKVHLYISGLYNKYVPEIDWIKKGSFY